MADAPGLAPVIPVAPGKAEMAKLRAGGFKDDELLAWRSEAQAKLDDAGFSPTEVQAYWGETPKQSELINSAMRAGVQRNQASNPQVATNPVEAFAAGLQMSVGGLIVRRKAPDVIGNMGDRSIPNAVASAAGQLIGDLPWAIGGAVMGGAAAGAVTAESGPGAVAASLVGYGAGASALPEASRQVLLAAYRGGEINNFDDFLKIAGEGAWSTAKAGVIGGVSNLVGGQIGAKALSAGASKFTATTADIGAQTVVGGVAGAAFEGRVPNANDFTAGAILALGVHAGTSVHGVFKASNAGRRVINNAQAVYEATGIPPWDLMDAATRDPGLRETLYTQDVSGNATIHPNTRAAAPKPPEPMARPAVKPVPPVEGSLPPKPRMAAPPPLAKAQSMAFFTKIMQAVEGGVGKNGEALVSSAGAIGKNQIMPGTARQYMGANFDIKRLYNHADNDMVKDRIIADLHDRFGGDTEAMLAGYNAGPGWGARLQREGAGTRLEAYQVKENGKTVTKYQRVAADRNEAILPMETQKYLANSRRRAGGPLPGGVDAISGVRRIGGGGGSDGPPGGSGKPPGGDGGDVVPVWFEEPRRPQDGGGGGGDEPPAGSQTSEPGGPERFNWSKASASTRYDDIRQGIGDGATLPKTASISSFIGQWATELEPLRQIDHMLIAEGEGLDRNHDMLLEDMGRQTYAADDIAGAMISWGRVRMDIDPASGKLMRTLDADGPSVKKAAEQVREDGGDLLDWEAYMVAQRAHNLHEKGIETPFNKENVAATVADRAEAKKYARATKTLQDALDGGLDFAVDAGLLSTAQKEAMVKANPIYVSFRRVAGDDAFFKAGGKNGRGQKVGKTFHKMEGSTEGQINSPVQAVMDNLRLTVRNATRNMVAGSIVSLAEQRGPVAAEMGLKRIPFKATISEAEGKAYRTLNPDGTMAPELDPFLAERAVKGFSNNQFPYYRNGVLEKWEVKDPQLAQFLRGVDSPGQADIVTKSFQAVAKVVRAGITLPADFAVRMTTMDQWQGFLYDPLHPAPFQTLFKGFADAVGLSDVAKEWVANGGAGASITKLDADYIARDVHSVFNETGVFDRMFNVVKHPLEFAQIVHERLDWADRIGYYKLAKERGIDPVKAATMSRKFKLDFAERGTGIVTQWMAKTIPFYSVGTLGLKQLAEGTVNNPGDKGGRALGTAAKTSGMLLRGIVGVTVPTVALYILNYWQDEYGDLPESQKYRNLPDWQRDTLFITPELGGVRMKLGMPREAGVLLGGGMTRLLDKFAFDDKHAFEGWADQFMGQFVMPLMPPALRAPIEATTNHSFFTGRPLVPGSLADASPDMQYADNTTEIAKGLSRFLSNQVPGDLTEWSPIIIENYVRSFSGSLGMAALQVLDTPFKPVEKPWEVANIPFVQGFVVRNPGMSAAPIQEFYEAYSDNRTEKKDKSLAKKRQNSEEMEGVDQELASVRLDRYAKAIQLQNALIKAANADTDMNRDEKRQYIEAAYSRMIVIARRGVELADRAKDHEGSGPAPAGAPAPGWQ